MQWCQALAVSDVWIRTAIKQATGLLDVVLNSRGMQLRAAKAINARHADAVLSESWFRSLDVVEFEVWKSCGLCPPAKLTQRFISG